MENNENIYKRKIVAEVKGKKIEFDEYYMVNPLNNEEVFNRDLELLNDIRLYDIYKRKDNLLTSVEIKEIRKKYEMNQKEFAKALGLGEITVHRFENGSIQTESVDSVMRLSENPDIMYLLLLKNKTNFEENEYLKFLKIASDLKKIKEHKVASFDIDEIKNLQFETESVQSVTNGLISMYNSRVDEISKRYEICETFSFAEYITPLKLQKLLYYIQGLSSFIFDKPAFNSDIYAWSYGPVSEEIYEKYKGRKPIVIPKEDIKLSPGLKRVIEIVISSYGRMEAEKLIELTHDEDPWKNTKKNSVIEFNLIRNYFKKVYGN